MTFGFFVTARRTFANSSQSPVKSLFCADKIESTEWQDPEPRQRIGGCFLIIPPRWELCDQPLSSHQTLCFASALSARSPCNFGSQADFAIAVFWEVSVENASWIFTPLSLDVLSPEKCVRVQTLLCPPDYLWTPPTIQEDLAKGRPSLDSHPSFYFGFGFLGVIRTSFPELARHVALGLDLLKTNTAMSMLKTNCNQNWRTTGEKQEVRNGPFCM